MARALFLGHELDDYHTCHAIHRVLSGHLTGWVIFPCTLEIRRTRLESLCLPVFPCNGNGALHDIAKARSLMGMRRNFGPGCNSNMVSNALTRRKVTEIDLLQHRTLKLHVLGVRQRDSQARCEHGD